MRHSNQNSGFSAQAGGAPPVQWADGTFSASHADPTPINGPGQSSAPGSMPTSSYGRRGRPSNGSGGSGGGSRQASQLAANEASGPPVEVSAGVWVYPNGQPVTGAQLAALNSASTVLPASMTSANSTLAAQEAAAAAAVPATSTVATSTGYFAQSTLYPPYSNGQVLGLAAAALAAFYLMKRR